MCSFYKYLVTLIVLYIISQLFNYLGMFYGFYSLSKFTFMKGRLNIFNSYTVNR